MEDRLRELLQDAFRQVPAHEANQAIARARRDAVGSGPDDEDAPAARSYEMILSTFAAFASELVPKLVYHLESIGAHLPECGGVMIAAFAGDRLYFVRARELVARACRMLSVTPEELVRRHGTGERRTAVGSEGLLLPGPKGDA
jgi:hypothetical protein